MNDDKIKVFYKMLEKIPKDSQEHLMYKIFYSINDLDKSIEFLKKLEMLPKNSLKMLLAYYTADQKKVTLELEDNETYNSILKKGIKLSQELGLSNSLELCILYTYLLWNGYFSTTKVKPFEGKVVSNPFSYNDEKNIGICLNYSDLLKDFINMSKYSSAIIVNKPSNIKINYSPEIMRNIKVNMLKAMKKNLSFHANLCASNLVIDKEGAYIYDPTNILLFELENVKKAKLINGEGMCKINSYYTHIYNLSKKSKSTLDYMYFSDNLKSPYSRKDFIFSFEMCMELFKDNIKLIYDYYKDIYKELKNLNLKQEKYTLKK